MPQNSLPLDRNARLVVEEERLRALPSFMFHLDDFNSEQGSACGVIRYNERHIEVSIRFEEDFPYQRPVLYTKDEVVRTYRHVTRSGQICVLRHEPEEWEPDTYTASFLVKRAWKLIANEGKLPEDEDDGMPQPLDFDVARGIVLLASETASSEPGGFGTAKLLAANIIAEGFTIHELLDRREKTLWRDSDESPFSRDAKVKQGSVNAVWFRAQKDPPFRFDSLDALTQLLPDGLSIRSLLDPLRRGKLQKGRGGYILIHYEDETGLRWAFVLFSEKRSSSGEVVTSLTYLPVYTVGVNAFFGRIDGLLNREQLSKAHVVVLGVGAIGSTVVEKLNQCGIGKLTIFDGQVVEPGNPVRGALPFNFTGLQKVEAVWWTNQKHLPFTCIHKVPYDTNHRQGREQLEALLLSGGVDAVVVAIGNHQASRGLDVILSRYAVPRLYAWTTRGAAAGVVLTCLPNEVSYEDYNQLVVDDEIPELPEVDETEIPNASERGCALPVLPATPLDIGVVALQAARTAVDILQKKDVSVYQTWIQESLGWQHFLLEPQGLVGDGMSTTAPAIKKAILSYSAKLAIEEHMRESLDRETGGVIMGETIDDELHVSWVSGPGYASKRSRTRFSLDVSYAQGCIDTARVLSDNRLRFIGEWHSHLGASLKPSDHDRRALQTLARSRNARINVPVILITTFDNMGEPKVAAYIHNNGKISEIKIDVPDVGNLLTSERH